MTYAGSQKFPREVVDSYMADPDAPVLVSFGRSGNHWLRLMCEVAFGRPILSHTMLHKGRTDFLFAQEHDNDLRLQRSNVMYLYRRNVIDVVYSYTSTPEGCVRDSRQVAQRAELYARHLAKWLLDERFTTHKTIFTYEGMLGDAAGQVLRVARHLGIRIDDDAARIAARYATKERLHDLSQSWSPGIVPTSDAYRKGRVRFAAEHGSEVVEAFLRVEPERLRGHVSFERRVD